MAEDSSGGLQGTVRSIGYGIRDRSHGFSSQPLNITPTSESEDCIEVTAAEIDEEGGRGSRKRWSAEEDVHLISAWLNTSKDPVVSNDQRLQSFWKRGADYYTAHDGGTSSNARGPSQCKASEYKKEEWTIIRRCCEHAYEFYKNDMKKPFMLGHCWRELKNDQKWITERHEECSNKRTKLASEGDFSAPSSNGGDEMRPPGVKAAKKKGKKPAVSIDVDDSSVSKLDKIIAMKDQEQAAKERHDKMKLLDILLNKGFGMTYEAVSLPSKVKHVGRQ
ncbi:PREDICTED: glutathione S-transferase T3-like [Camelina sativa]|uniref:Glutathione S-transferase T3-like n=1 Tax=Camelina sativa TaxID=90675 RepID=A0ABM0TDA7_CAMSA|nr:PREDICTED: glutathione S-transferase T3-like [Camelina sativa]